MKKMTKSEVDVAKKNLSNVLSKFVKASASLLKPLESLNEEQIAALFTLGYSLRIFMSLEHITDKGDKAVLKNYKKVIDEICPPLGNIVIAKDPVFEAEVSYLSALAECEKEGKSEDECPKAWEFMAQIIMAEMKEVEEMRRELINIYNGMNPPRPFPWPI